MTKYKIAVIGIKGLPAYGGAAAVGENIIHQLKEQYDFTVLSVSSHTSKENTNVNGIKQIVFRNNGKGGLNTFIYYLKCLAHVLLNKYDLVHLHHAESGFITPLLRLRYKAVVTFHGIFSYTDPKFSRLQNLFFRFSEGLNMRWANVVVSVSETDKDYIFQKYKRIVEYIPNGMTVNINQSPTAIHGKQEEYIFFAAGRIYQIKGLHLLLKAARSMAFPIKIVVAGDMDQVEEYKTEILTLSQGIEVQYLGLIKEKSELVRLIQGAKIFVFPSVTEAMSMMLLEVVSTGTPVIASDIPSNKAIFTNDELLFFKNNDSNDLSLKLNYAIANPNEMAQKANFALKKSEKCYNWQAIGQSYSKIYNKLISQ